MANDRDRVVGIDVGGTTIKGAAFDRQGRVCDQRLRPTGADRGPEAVIESILEVADELASFDPQPMAYGIAVPGLVRESDGMVLEATNLGLRDAPMHELASRRLSAPVAVLHDVRAAALAEGMLGAARGCNDYLLLTLGTGIGAAVVIGGRPYTGARGIGGELGHVAVDPRGPLCLCGGTGCLEAIASAGAVERRFGQGLDAEQVADRAASGDPSAARVWREALDALALAIVNYATLLDPELVVIGGGLASAGPRLFDPLRERVRESTRFGKPVRVVRAALGEEAGRYGAALTAWREVGLEESALATWGEGSSLATWAEGS